jgi:hypothetical protein
MRHNYKIAMVLFFANISISTGVAFADDKLKGTYVVAGTQACLAAPSGFQADSKGNPAIALGNDSSVSVSSFQTRFSFNGDETGTASGTYVGMPAPPPAKAAVGAGTFSYSFTHTPVANNSFTLAVTPRTYEGAFNYGPAAGLQFTIDTYHRVFHLSNDQKYGTMSIATPEVEHVIWWEGDQTKSIARICYTAGSVARLD